MADFVDSTVRDIDQRLTELKEEVERLEAARSALIGRRRGPGRPRGSSRSTRGRAARSTGRGPGRPPGRPRGRPRGRRGGNTRGNQALELVRSRPGITIPEIAQEMKIEPNYLYRVLPRLADDGQVRREGQGWVPVSS